MLITVVIQCGQQVLLGQMYEDPTKVIASPGGYFLAPENEERIGDVSNVLFTNGWIADEDGKVFTNGSLYLHSGRDLTLIKITQ